MATRVYLHVGAPKTGTSYLQRMLWGNRQSLRRAGYLLPGSRAAHYQAMGDLRRGLWYSPDAPWTWDRLVAETRAWDGVAVISEEMLGAATQEEAERAVESFAPAEVHVVVAGRDLWRTIPSSWQQSVRSRSVGRFRDYVRAVQTNANPAFWEHQTPLPILRRWASDLSPSHRHLVTVPPPGSEPSLLWSRFAGVLGVPEGVCHADDRPGNVSLGAAETELLRRVNVALGDRYQLRSPYLRLINRHLVSPVLAPRERNGRFGASAEMADWVTTAAKRMVAEFDDFPCQVAGDLDDLVPRDLRASSSPDDLDEASMLHVAVETIVGMLDHTRELVDEMAVREARLHEQLEATERAAAGRRAEPGLMVRETRRAAAGVRRRLRRLRRTRSAEQA
ncbi:MAG: hypothetical protein GEV10_18405 [Streptosporangiales bacterium]|nr:hypothetical protein [Streptosporangiales bacterium]